MELKDEGISITTMRTYGALLWQRDFLRLKSGLDTAQTAGGGQGSPGRGPLWPLRRGSKVRYSAGRTMSCSIEIFGPNFASQHW